MVMIKINQKHKCCSLRLPGQQKYSFILATWCSLIVINVSFFPWFSFEVLQTPTQNLALEFPLTKSKSSRFSCLKWPCVDRDLLWLHFGETERYGFVKRGAWWRRCAGCSRCCSLKRKQSSPAGTVSTSTLADTWTKPPASGLRDSDYYNSQSLTETKEHTSFFVTDSLCNVSPQEGVLSTNMYPAHNMLMTLDTLKR